MWIHLQKTLDEIMIVATDTIVVTFIEIGAIESSACLLYLSCGITPCVSFLWYNTMCIGITCCTDMSVYFLFKRKLSGDGARLREY